MNYGECLCGHLREHHQFINTIRAEVILDTLVKNAYAICSEARRSLRYPESLE
jgi:hypothetical protein